MANIIVYNVIPINDSFTAKIQKIGSYNTKQRSHLPDIPLKVLKLDNNVMCEILKCNITHHFMASNPKLPVIRLTVLYTRKMSVTKLMSVYLYFTISDKIKSLEQLLKNKHNGIFTIEADINNEKVIISENNLLFTNETDMIIKLEELINNVEMKELIETLQRDKECEIKQIYNKQLKEIEEDFQEYIKKV